jgi:ankyrin repeat protein
MNPEAKTTNLFTFEPVRNLNPRVPEHIETLIASMVEMRIADRPLSMRAVREWMNGGAARQTAPRRLTLALPAAVKKSAPKTSLRPSQLLSLIDEQEMLFNAVKKGDIETVKNLLAQGMDVNTRTGKGETPLHNAALNGQTETAKLLIERGANINAKDNYRRTPLHIAEAEGNRDIADLLRKLKSKQP